MALGKQIKNHRNARKLTLDQLSEMSGVDIGTISALENRDSVRSKYAIALAAAMGMTVEQLETLPSEDFIEGESVRIDEKTAPALPSTVKVSEFQSPRDRQIGELLSLVKSMSDEGLSIAIYETRKIASQYPIAKQTPESFV